MARNSKPETFTKCPLGFRVFVINFIEYEKTYVFDQQLLGSLDLTPFDYFYVFNSIY